MNEENHRIGKDNGDNNNEKEKDDAGKQINNNLK